MDKYFSGRRAAGRAVFMLAVLWTAVAPAEEDERLSRRRTDTVKTIQRCLPAVVAIRTFAPHPQPGVFYIHNGSGTIVHPSGYILTNDHVVMNAVRGEVTLYDDQVLPYRIIAHFPHEDMALVKVNAKQPLTAITLGHSDDLMLGEPALVIGAPGGLVRTVSTGIVSGLNRSTTTEHAFLPWMIQTSAATSGGSSGGPLINALGEQIGIITSEKKELEAVNFAIAIDRVRLMLPQMIAAEQRFAFRLGMEVDTLGKTAKVTELVSDSPAAMAGVKLEDVVESIDDISIREGFDFYFALIDRQAGQKMKLRLRRGDETCDVELTLAELPIPPAVEDKGMINGIHFEAYAGEWDALPDFASQKPVADGRGSVPDVAAHKPSDDNFAIRYTGFVKIPADGLYTFFTASDDGSQLHIGERLVVDNNGLHPSRESAGVIRLSAGLHPITVAMFEQSGDEALKVAIEGPNLNKQAIPAEMWFVRDVK
jgi:S1-C subfamily serine protease